MKKNINLRIIVGLIISLALLTWLVPAGRFDMAGLAVDQLNPVGFWGLLSYPLMEGVQYFLIYGIFALAIGGLYGVINKTGAYKNLLDTIVKKFKKKEIWFVAGTVVVMAGLSATTGATLPLLVFVPFLVSIILLLGYDKLVAILATVGALLVGSIGAIYGFTNAVFFRQALQIENVTAGWPYALALLVGGVALIIWYVVCYEKKKKSVKKAELDKTDTLFYGGKKTKKPVWPLVTVFATTFVITILSTISWVTLFGERNAELNIFQNAYEWLMTYEIAGFTLFANIFGRMSVFGEWTITDITALVLVATLVIGLLYRVKLKDMYEGFVEGVNKLAGTAFIIWLIYTILIITVYHPFFLTIMTGLVNITSGFNPITFSVITTVATVLHVDTEYFANIVVPVLPMVYEGINTTHLAVFAQSIHSFVLLLVPTSVVLIFGLTYLDVPYTTWMKFIWKFAAALFVLIAIVISILTSTYSMLIFVLVLAIICVVCKKFICPKLNFKNKKKKK